MIGAVASLLGRAPTGLKRLEAERSRRQKTLQEQKRKGPQFTQFELVTLGGQTWHVEVDLLSSGAELKERVAKVTGVPEVEVALVCGDVDIGYEETPLLKRMQSSKANAPLQITVVRVAQNYRLFSAHEDGLKLWDVGRGALLLSLIDSQHETSCVAVNLSEKCALSGGGSSSPALKLWDLSAGICVESFVGHEKCINCMVVDWEVQMALTGSSDCSLRLWDLSKGQCTKIISCESTCSRWRQCNVPLCAQMDWTLHQVLTGNQDGSLRLWDLQKGELVKSGLGSFKNQSGISQIYIDGVQIPDRACQCLSVNWTEQLALSGHDDKTLKFWNMADKHIMLLGILRGHKGTVSAMSVDWHAKRALSAAADGTLRMWDLDRQLCVRVYSVADAAQNLSLAVDWSTRKAVIGSRQGLKTQDLDLENGEPEPETEPQVVPGSSTLDASPVRCLAC